MEFVPGVNYEKFAGFLGAYSIRSSAVPSIGKAEIKSLLGLAQGNRERELIRYSIFKSSGTFHISR